MLRRNIKMIYISNYNPENKISRKVHKPDYFIIRCYLMIVIFIRCAKKKTRQKVTAEWNRERNKLKRPYAAASELMTLIALRGPGILLTCGIHVIVRGIARL